MTLCSKLLATAFILTSERLFTGVNPQMGLEVSVLSEGFATHATNKRLFPGVSPFVNLKSSRSWIFLAANLAFVWLFSGVNEFMCLQMSLGDKALLATFKAASERSIPSMGPHVGLKVACIVEFLNTCSEWTKQNLVCGTCASQYLVKRLTKRLLIMVKLTVVSCVFYFWFGVDTDFVRFWVLDVLCVHYQIVLSVEECLLLLNNVVVFERGICFILYT